MTIDRSYKDLSMVPTPDYESAPGESRFLKYQDKNGDGLPDVCITSVRPAPVCLDCVPNPYAIVPNWRNRDETEPILNQKSCEYQITIVTPHINTGYTEGMSEEEADQALNEKFERHAEKAIQIILEEFQKDDSPETIEKIKSVVKFKDWNLEAREGSRLKLLYSIPFEYIFGLPDIQEGAPAPEDEEEADDIKVKFRAGSMNATSIRLRKGLNLYGRYLKVMKATEGGNLKFKQDDRIFNLGAYGDDALFGSSQMAHVMSSLDAWLDSRGYTMSFGFWDWFSTNEQITNLVLVFNSEYKIKLMKVYTEGCGQRPSAVYKFNRLASLRKRRGWKDRTAVAYLAHMDAMVSEIGARSPRPWTEVLEEYTYPDIYVHKPDGSVGEPTIASCISQKIENEFIDLGQDIFDEVFSIGDAIAYAFRNAVCRTDPDQVNKDLAEMGVNPSTTVKDIWNAQSMAQMQNFFTVDEKDPIFVNMCKRALLYRGFGGASMQQLDQLYKHGLGPLKICGLFDLLLEAMECLFKGLSLEEALGRIILASLKAMGIKDFGKLFVGLPAEKRAELDALVKKNLKSGKAFSDMSAEGLGGAESQPLVGDIDIQYPWENEEFVEHEEQTSTQENFGAKVPKRGPNRAYDPDVERRTLGQRLAGPSEQQKQGLDPSTVFDAYILALIEVYQDNMLSLLDSLSNFPGAQLISAVIALLDCPTPPLFNPGIMDFIKSIGLPFCRNQQDIVAPRIENPFAAWPKLTDILWWLYIIVRYMIIQLIMKILLAILAKLCELIGNAICKALETVGAVAASLPGIISGRQSLMSVIKETICGPDASDEDVENTVVDLVAQLGVGGAALADRDTAINFFAEAINSMTREELIESFLDGPSEQTANLIYQKVQFDFPEYSDAFPDPDSIGRFFKNAGNLIDPEVKSSLRDILSSVPEEMNLPANPSICATPEQIEMFEASRCALLEGRMSPEQCDQMSQNAKAQLLEDLDDIGNVLQQGVPAIIEANMPPIFSDPGCDNGLLPQEPAEQAMVATMALGGDMQKIQVAYARDMMGAGGFFSSQKDWGFLNMALADTYGNPFTIHNEKVINDFRFVDYYGQPEYDEVPEFPPVPGNPFLLPVWIIEVVAFVTLVFPISMFIKLIQLLFMGDKKGAFPKYVAPFLKGQFLGPNTDDNGATGRQLMGQIHGGGSKGWSEGSSLPSDLHSAGSLNFVSTNNIQVRKKFWRSFESLGFIWRFLFLSDTDVELVDIPDQGWNTRLSVDFRNDKVAIVRKPRKLDPDIVLRYFDNAKGYRARGVTKAAYGFSIGGYYSDIIQKGDSYVNRPDDNMRVEILSHVNPLSPSNISALKRSLLGTGMDPSQADREIADVLGGNDKFINTRRFEFLATDGGFDNIELFNYPTMLNCFERQQWYSPPVGALVDLTRGELTVDAAKSHYEMVNNDLYKEFSRLIGKNDKGWNYGYHPDPAGSYELQMGVKATEELAGLNEVDEGSWIPYEDLLVPEYDNDGNKTGDSKDVENEDGVVAISRDQFDNEKAGTPELTRVFYLNPNVYGGSYSNPPVYIKQYKPDGWLGLVNILFPERSPCTPRSQGIIRFDDIKQKVDSMYSRIPEDKRLRGNEDCVFEAPFNRILTRPSKAGIRGLIMAAIRIYGSVAMTKCLPTFTMFAPDFKSNYSNIFAAYIVERMKESLWDAGGNFANSFNDTEFWYAFLEQSVQFYTDRLNDEQDEDITPDTVPPPVQEAIHRMDNLQENYKYPWNFDDYSSDDSEWFEGIRSFRESKNLEAVRSVESEAKLVLQELVKEQLHILGEAFIKNTETYGLTPSVYNLDYWFIENFVDTGGEAYVLNLQGNHVEKAKADSGLGTGKNQYTAGGQLALPSGTPYIGEYHTHLDESGATIYMSGPVHEGEEHDLLIPFARELEVYASRKDDNGIETMNPIGDIASEKDGHSTTPSSAAAYMRKIIIIDDQVFSDAEGISTIRAKGSGNLSDYWPGNMQLVIDPDTDRPIGITGELGVYYGLEFGVPGGKIATVKINALDLTVGQFKGVEANSKILLCLINAMIDHPEYRLAVDYVFNLKKNLSMLAIYNDMGLIPSVGETTVEEGDMYGGDLLDTFQGIDPVVYKPGMRANSFEVSAKEEGGGFETKINEGYTVGWASEDDRNSLFSSFGYVDFDEWDQVVLRKSARTLKNIFKPYYKNRKFSVEEDDGPSPAEQFISNITERFRFNPATRILPASRRKYIRSNPFDADGNMCVRKN